MSGKQTTALVIIFLYMALTVVVGLVSSKMKQKKAEESKATKTSSWLVNLWVL